MGDTTILKLKLKSHWDFPQNYNPKEKSGIFVGREQEKEKLTDIITRKKSGSILLCGPRGVGKTALVYTALREGKSKTTEITPVLLNISQIEAQKDDGQTELTHKDVLINLIRRLYTTLEKEDGFLDGKIKNLYFKAAAKEWQIKKVLGEERESVDLTTNREMIELNIDINLKSLISKIIGTIMIFLAIYPKLFPFSNIIFGILGLIAFFFEYIELWWKKTTISKLVKRLIEKRKDKAEEIYSIDASVGNLEYELSEVLSDLTHKNRKVVFIVDELDKYGKTPQNILELIKTYKNLFSLTPALFLFITGSEIYETLFDIPRHPGSLLKEDSQNNKGNQGNQKIESELYRTTFSEVFYLSRPNYNDISSYLDKILEEEELKKLKGDNNQLKKWEEFKHYLGFESEDDFFKLIRTIKNFTKKEKTGEIFLEINQKDFLDEEKAKAKFHKALFLIYKDSSFSKPMEWAYNESLYFGLFEVVRVLDAPNSQIQLSFNKERDEIKESQKKLIDVLEKVGALQVIQRDDNQAVFSWTHRDFEIGDTIEGPYPHEEKFIKVFDELLVFSRKLAEVFNKTFTSDEDLINWVQSISGVSVSSNFNLFKETKEKIKQNEHFNIEEINKYKEELKNEMQNLYSNIITLYSNGVLQSLPNSQQGKLDQDNLFGCLENDTREKIKKYNHSVVYNVNLSKQILVIENCSREDLLELNKWKKNFEFSHKIIDIKQDLQSLEPVNNILEWFNKTKIKLGIGDLKDAEVISGVPSKEKIKRKLYLKLNKTGGISIDGKNPHTFLIIDKEYTDFNVTMEVTLNEGGIFNLVFGFNENENKQKSFYMIRLDAREGYKNSLLQANYGETWNFIVEGQLNTHANTPHILEVVIKNNNLQVNLDKSPMISYTFPQEIKGRVGLMNELEDVFLRKIKFR